MMHGRDKSDPEVVAIRSTKGNVGQQSTLRAQDRVGVSQALDRIRQAARQNKKERFTALLHHINPETLRLAFNALKKDAAPGVDRVTWSDYEVDLERKLEALHDRVTEEHTGLNRHAGYIYRRRTVGSARSQSPASRTKSFQARSRWC